MSLMAGLGYGEEVQWFINLGEWSNTISYEMSSSLAEVYNVSRLLQ